MTTSENETGAEVKTGAVKRRNLWRMGHPYTIAAGLLLLVCYELYDLHHMKWGAVGGAVVDLLGRELGTALVIAGTVAVLFDTGYHKELFTDPVAKLRESVNQSTDELGQFTESAKVAVAEAVANFLLLSRSNALGVVALHERGNDFKDVLRTALESDKGQDCWIVGRTHKEMLGLHREGKGWLVEAIETKLGKPGFTMKILLANPFDLADDTSASRDQNNTLPPRCNAARGQIHGGSDAREAIYDLLAVLAHHATTTRIELRLLRSRAVPYCLLMTDERLFVEHYLPSCEGGALPIAEIEPKKMPREPSPYEYFRKDVADLFDRGEDCVVVLKRFNARKCSEYSDDPGEVSVPQRYPKLKTAIDNGQALADARNSPNFPQPKPAEFLGNRAYASQISVYSEIVKYVRRHPSKEPMEAILLQYSAVKAEDVLTELICQGAQVALYVQSPDVARQSKMTLQSERISGQMGHLREVLARNNPTKKGSCKFYYYHPRATLRGVWIKDHLLAIGPYIYQNSAENPDNSEDRLVIKGHDAPGMLFWFGSPEYDVFSVAFEQVINNFSEGLVPFSIYNERASAPSTAQDPA